jgi:hypothetical protein
MNKERHRKKFKKEELEMDSLIESDEHFGFIVGYTSNGASYGLTHFEMDKIMDDIKNEMPEKDNLELPF